MPFKFSRCISLQTDRMEDAVEFYEKVLGLRVLSRDDPCVEIDGSQNRLFIETGKQGGPVFELIVDDLETARDELVSKGCEVVVWQGKGKDCYIRDPFGFMFNLWEDAEAFSD